MNPAEFLRLHALRAPNIAWFLGAGASAAGRVPTAQHMIWEFKRTLYCAREQVSIRTLADLGDPALRRRLQHHFDQIPGSPAVDSPDEYAVYFETAYPSEGDRRKYLDARLSGATPSFGHYVLAALMKMDRVRVVWTTNFDRLLEDGAATTFGTTGKLVVATLGEPLIAAEAIEEQRWPLLGKLHGDFHSRRLKNIETELLEQDAALREALVETSRRFGVAVVGYSGRDDSVMDALESALAGVRAYPFGLFWFHRDDAPLLPRVLRLIERAQAAGVEAAVIPIETFDEVMSDLLLLEADVPAELTQMLEKRRTSRVSSVPLPGHQGDWPVLRLSALPVIDWPRTCRRVRCEIGGAREVREAVAEAGAQLIVARRQAGVICFGRDDEARRVFSPFGISEFDLYAIEPRRLRYWDSSELGLLYEALGYALARELPLIFRRSRSGHRLIVDASRSQAIELDALRKAAGGIAGRVDESGVPWSEALRFRLEYRLDRLWLLLEPSVALFHEGDAPRDEASRSFVRERLAARYNPVWNGILDAWISLLIGDGETRVVRALGISDGIDAIFKLSRITAFSRRAPV